MSFSKRYGFLKDVIIYEDAPKPFRYWYTEYIVSLLSYGQIEPLYRKICFEIKYEPEEYNPMFAFTLGKRPHPISKLLHDCEWNSFYDAMELIAQNISEKDDIAFDSHRNYVNMLLKHHQIGWRLNRDGKLEKSIPEDMINQMNELENVLTSDEIRYQSVHAHFLKARKYCFEFPIDLENSVKEIVLALESIIQIIFNAPGKTPGKVKEKMKVEGIPAGIVELIVKIYGYASSEPAIRHGSPNISNLQYIDAEFLISTTSAIIKYLIEFDQQRQN